MCLTGQDTFARLITRIISSCYGSSTNFLPKGKSFFPSRKYASLPKSQFSVETFTCPYFQQTPSILQTFCEPIFGFQCVLDSTDGDSIADRISLYRAHNPLFVTTAPAGAPSPIYFLSLTLCASLHHLFSFILTPPHYTSTFAPIPICSYTTSLPQVSLLYHTEPITPDEANLIKTSALMITEMNPVNFPKF